MQRGRWPIFLFLIFLSVFLFVLQLKGILGPVESALAEAPRPFVYVLKGVGNSVGSFFSYFGQVSKINKQNASLSEQVRTLEEENSILQQYKFENEELRKELDYRKISGYNLISASVIGKDPSGFSQTININAGSHEGVKVGAAVLSQGVFIGKISEAETFSSTVTLVTDPQSSIDAQIGGSDQRGILRGSYGSGITLDLISQSAQLTSGQEVVTAGLNSQVPKGLLIGTIGTIQSNQNDLLQKVTVVSPVDLSNLDFVSIIQQ